MKEDLKVNHRPLMPVESNHEYAEWYASQVLNKFIEQMKENVPDLTSSEISEVSWKVVEEISFGLPGPIFNELKPAVHSAIKLYHQLIFD